MAVVTLASFQGHSTQLYLRPNLDILVKSTEQGSTVDEKDLDAKQACRA